jgi:prepilin signal peptidase PulO-like enzyme (type II secretory pathway)
MALEFGGVLLVVPLPLAVAHADLHLVLWWQLSATFSGAVHAAVITRGRDHTSIPFGPYLLPTGWVLMLVGVWVVRMLVHLIDDTYALDRQY